MDGIFRQYVLGALSTVLSAKIFPAAANMEAGDGSICYAKLDDSVITDDIKGRPSKLKATSSTDQLFLQRSCEKQILMTD